jgi:hypothetical protein
MKKLSILTYIFIILFAACRGHLKEFTPSAGDADFSHYVAIGNSLTAGYSNGALYISGQQNSYANILAQQFQTVGGGAFKIPYMADDLGVGFVNTTPVTKRVLRNSTDCLGNTSLSPVLAGSPNLANFNYIGGQGPYNNMGVPGAKSFHLGAPQFGSPTGNPFYARFASNPGTSTVIGDAMAQNPTFFTFWIGSNDILLYALAGGKEGKDSITSNTMFDAAIAGELTALTSTNAKGAIANIPDITSVPYFTTVPYNGLVLTDPTDVNNLNAAYSGTGIAFHLGQNPFIISDSSVPGIQLRQIQSSEFILLSIPQDSLKCNHWGSLKPIPGQYVLDAQEINSVNAATLHYNQSILNFANLHGLAFIDVNETIKQLKSGLTFEGITLTTQFVSGGAFSLDGVHLTPRGNAVVANQFIQSINAKFNASIPMVDVSNYQGVQFP